MNSSVRHYALVMAGLLGLLLVTVGAAYVHFGAFNTAVAMLISLAKAGLIVWYFMHVRLANPVLRVFVFAGFFWLGLLLVLTMGDFLSR